jgi:hypothetical protein
MADSVPCDRHPIGEARPSGLGRRRFLGWVPFALLLAAFPGPAGADWPPARVPRGRRSRALRAAEQALRERRRKAQEMRRGPKAPRRDPAGPAAAPPSGSLPPSSGPTRLAPPKN